MKKLFIAILISAVTISSFSQDSIRYKNSFGMNFTQLINSCFRMQYEHFFANKNSLVINAGVVMRTGSGYQYGGGVGELQYRFNAPLNFLFEKGNAYFAPYAGYQYVEYKANGGYNYDPYFSYGSTIREYSNISGGLMFGVRTNLTSRFFFDVNVGGGFRYDFNNDQSVGYYNNRYNLGTQQLGYSGVYPRANVLLGINF